MVYSLRIIWWETLSKNDVEKNAIEPINNSQIYFIKKCCEKSPNLRYTTQEVLNHIEHCMKEDLVLLSKTDKYTFRGENCYKNDSWSIDIVSLLT